MKKARKRIRDFAKWAFRKEGLRPIPVWISYKWATVVCGGEVGFGVFCYDYAAESEDVAEPGTQRIYAAGKLFKTDEMLRIVAHEIVHYKQLEERGNLDFAEVEDEAEEQGRILVERYKQEVRKGEISSERSDGADV